MARPTRTCTCLLTAFVLAVSGVQALPQLGGLKVALFDSVRNVAQPSFASVPLERRDASNSTNSTSTSNSSLTTDVWVVSDEYSGKTFFDDWWFFTGTDPTNGLVDYVDRDTAFNESLVYVTDNNTVTMKGDNTSWVNIGDHRKSVRIQSNKYWTGGLFILDLNRAPWGCGVWPAFWSLGATEQWPAQGEIDILEGVHDNVHNQVTWHTEPGCVLANTGNFTGTLVGQTECDATINSNSGCGITDWSRVSYGETFDAQGGGVYAMLWDETGIAVWYFYRVSIPQDILDGEPKPKTWTTPSASLAPASCDPFKYFQNHAIVFDITFCGDWAGNTYATTPGCTGTCQEHLQDPANFINASWSINSLKVYTKDSLQGVVTSAGRSNSSPKSSVFLLTLSVGLLALIAIC